MNDVNDVNSTNDMNGRLFKLKNEYIYIYSFAALHSCWFHNFFHPPHLFWPPLSIAEKQYHQSTTTREQQQQQQQQRQQLWTLQAYSKCCWNLHAMVFPQECCWKRQRDWKDLPLQRWVLWVPRAVRCWPVPSTSWGGVPIYTSMIIGMKNPHPKSIMTACFGSPMYHRLKLLALWFLFGFVGTPSVWIHWLCWDPRIKLQKGKQVARDPLKSWCRVAITAVNQTRLSLSLSWIIVVNQ